MTAPVEANSERPGRSALVTATFAALLSVAFIGFVALGIWQIQRMAWKHDLIARVDARVHAAPVPAPARAQWPAVSDGSDGYRHVSVAGRFMPGMESRTQAVTELGAGFWSMVPLRTDQGDYVLINRGFVPAGDRGTSADATSPPQGRVVVTGLLRISEPGGGFLRHNDAAKQRWYSRDVAAIAKSHGLPVDRVAPYFIDADFEGERSGSGATTWPRGGLTVVKFRDSHLSYALTWFGMALLTLVGAWFLFASQRRLRHHRRR